MVSPYVASGLRFPIDPCNGSVQFIMEQLRIQNLTHILDIPFPARGVLFSYLSIKDISRLSLANAFFLQKTQVHYISKERLSRFYGLTFAQSQISYKDILCAFEKCNKKFKHKKLMKIFGGLENYLQIPTYQPPKKELTESPYDPIQKISKEIFFYTLPSVFRIVGKNGKDMAQVVIKYTLFVPMEHDKTMCSDRVDHNYFVLDSNDTYASAEEVHIRDPIVRLGQGHTLFSGSKHEAIISTFTDAIKVLLANKPVGILKDYKISHRYIYNGRFLEKYPERVFKDIPILKGHVSLEHMLSLFKMKVPKMKIVADYIVEESGHIVATTESDLIDHPTLKIYSFEDNTK